MAEEITYDWDAADPSTCGPLTVGAVYDGFSTAKVRIRRKTEAHYHDDAHEMYRVEAGEGTLKTRHRETGETEEYALSPGTEVVIEPDEIHQTRPDEDLLVTTVSVPAWREDDEIVVDDLF
jgi:mannose-6-phosphate isomerase-like protein (cupin superfamily)